MPLKLSSGKKPRVPPRLPPQDKKAKASKARAEVQKFRDRNRTPAYIKKNFLNPIRYNSRKDAAFVKKMMEINLRDHPGRFEKPESDAMRERLEESGVDLSIPPPKTPKGKGPTLKFKPLPATLKKRQPPPRKGGKKRRRKTRRKRKKRKTRRKRRRKRRRKSKRRR